jgi:hypothetical protein
MQSVREWRLKGERIERWLEQDGFKMQARNIEKTLNLSVLIWFQIKIVPSQEPGLKNLRTLLLYLKYH